MKTTTKLQPNLHIICNDRGKTAFQLYGNMYVCLYIFITFASTMYLILSRVQISTARFHFFWKNSAGFGYKQNI